VSAERERWRRLVGRLEPELRERDDRRQLRVHLGRLGLAGGGRQQRLVRQRFVGLREQLRQQVGWGIA
jgi:hypothetical protein